MRAVRWALVSATGFVVAWLAADELLRVRRWQRPRYDGSPTFLGPRA